MKQILLAGAALSVVATAASAQARPPLTLELRGGGAVATEELGGTDLDTGAGFQATLAWQALPSVGLYAGWDWYRFGFEEAVGGFDELDDTGYAFGVRLDAPSFGMLTPWVSGGGVYDHVELEGEGGTDPVSSDHTLGWELGAGATIPLGPRLALAPGVRYRSFSPELTELGGEATLSYVALEVGLSAALGGAGWTAASRR